MSIKVRITVGNSTVEIEAPPERLEEAVRQVVSAIRSAGVQIEGGVQERQFQRRKGQRAVTCRKIVEDMVGEGWFLTPRSLSEVATELARRGYSYDTTAISHVLLDMVREGVLVREGEARRYLYRQQVKRIEVKEEKEEKTVKDEV